MSKLLAWVILAITTIAILTSCNFKIKTSTEKQEEKVIVQKQKPKKIFAEKQKDATDHVFDLAEDTAVKVLLDDF